MNQLMPLIFCMERIIERRFDERDYYFWLDVARLCLLLNQIAGFFDYQYCREKSVDMFLIYGVSHQEKFAPET